MKSNKVRTFGFTLMEIMISIAIVGILVLMVALNVTASQRKSRDLKRKSDLSSIGKAFEMYYNDNNRYPDDDNSGNIMGCPDKLSQCPWGGEFGIPNTVTYMVVLPTDPRGDRNYYYETDDFGTYYKIYADLENTEDPQYGAGGYSGTECTDQPDSCTFGLTSTNVSLGEPGGGIPGPTATPGFGPQPTATPAWAPPPPTSTPPSHGIPTPTPNWIPAPPTSTPDLGHTGP